MHSKNVTPRTFRGFSLAELLITLGIIGVCAAFAIPAIINSSSPTGNLNAKQTAQARELAFMLLQAYEQYRSGNTVTGATTPGDLTPYMNYVSVQTTGAVDGEVGTAVPVNCGDGSSVCLKLHNGGVLTYSTSVKFINDAVEPSRGFISTDALGFFFDPDGVNSGSANDSASKSVLVFLYYDGTIRSWGTCTTDTRGNGDGTGYNPGNRDPSWFSGF